MKIEDVEKVVNLIRDYKVQLETIEKINTAERVIIDFEIKDETKRGLYLSDKGAGNITYPWSYIQPTFRLLVIERINQIKADLKILNVSLEG